MPAGVKHGYAEHPLKPVAVRTKILHDMEALPKLFETMLRASFREQLVGEIATDMPFGVAKTAPFMLPVNRKVALRDDFRLILAKPGLKRPRTSQVIMNVLVHERIGRFDGSVMWLF